MSLYVRCCLAVALLAPLGHAAAAPVPREASPPPVSAGAGTTVAAGETMHGHGAPGEVARVGDLVVENPWARESVTPSGAAYLTVRNAGDEDDRLVGISTSVADRAKLHTSVMQDGVMRMRPVEAMEVPAHGEAVLEPGGLHIMLIGLQGPLQEGGSFALTLTFERAGEVEVLTPIEDIAHGGAGQHRGHGG